MTEQTGQENGILKEWLKGRANTKRGGLSWRYRIMANLFAVMDRKQAWREKYA